MTGFEKNLLDPKILELIGLIIVELINKEGPILWKESFLTIISLLDLTKDKEIINAVLDFLNLIFEKSDDRISLIVENLNQKLLDLVICKEVNK